MPLFKVVLGIAAVGVGPLLFGFLWPSVENLTYWGLLCELIAWGAIVAEIYKIDRLFNRTGFLQRLLQGATKDAAVETAPAKVKLPSSFRGSRLKLRPSGDALASHEEWALRETETHLKKMLDELHKAHSKAIQDVDAHLSTRLAQVETRLREAVTSDLGWAYFLAILAAGGLVLSTAPAEVVDLWHHR